MSKNHEQNHLVIRQCLQLPGPPCNCPIVLALLCLRLRWRSSWTARFFSVGPAGRAKAQKAALNIFKPSKPSKSKQEKEYLGVVTCFIPQKCISALKSTKPGGVEKGHPKRYNSVGFTQTLSNAQLWVSSEGKISFERAARGRKWF